MQPHQVTWIQRQQCHIHARAQPHSQSVQTLESNDKTITHSHADTRMRAYADEQALRNDAVAHTGVRHITCDARAQPRAHQAHGLLHRTGTTRGGRRAPQQPHRYGSIYPKQNAGGGHPRNIHARQRASAMPPHTQPQSTRRAFYPPRACTHIHTQANGVRGSGQGRGGRATHPRQEAGYGSQCLYPPRPAPRMASQRRGTGWSSRGDSTQY